MTRRWLRPHQPTFPSDRCVVMLNPLSRVPETVRYLKGAVLTQGFRDTALDVLRRVLRRLARLEGRLELVGQDLVNLVEVGERLLLSHRLRYRLGLLDEDVHVLGPELVVEPLFYQAGAHGDELRVYAELLHLLLAGQELEKACGRLGVLRVRGRRHRIAAQIRGHAGVLDHVGHAPLVLHAVRKKRHQPVALEHHRDRTVREQRLYELAALYGCAGRNQLIREPTLGEGYRVNPGRVVDRRGFEVATK